VTARPAHKPQQHVAFVQAAIGKKVLMALSGVVLFGFVVVHMLGNLQVFLGPEKMNAYGAMLRATPALLWGVRVVLFIAVVVHVATAVQLARDKRAARPIRYARYAPVHSSYAARTMLWSGPLLLVFIVYHLLDLTVGKTNPMFLEGLPYDNLVSDFHTKPVAIAYMLAMGLLCMHLYHGVFSLTQSLGVSHPAYSRLLKHFAMVIAFVVAAGFISIPVAVMAGIVS
jgi:succinate dehydrogenase / fumarate reductase cytochrome b subunit